MRWDFIWKQIKDFLFDALVIVLADLIIAVPVMLAWNCVMPTLTKLPELGFLQVFSLMFLMIIVKNALFKHSN